MKIFILLAVCVAGALSATSYYEAPQIKVASYDAPAPVVRAASSYDYVAPVPEVKSTYYSAPVEVKSASYYAAPVEVRRVVPQIVRFNYNDDNHGTFNFDHLSEDKTSLVESGTLKNLGDPEGPVSVMRGSYSFVGDDSVTYTVNWTADENGFVASGDHLPTPPPLPIVEAPFVAAEPLPLRSHFVAPVIRSFPTFSHLPVEHESQIFDASNIHVISH